MFFNTNCVTKKKHALDRFPRTTPAWSVHRETPRLFKHRWSIVVPFTTTAVFPERFSRETILKKPFRFQRHIPVFEYSKIKPRSLVYPISMIAHLYDTSEFYGIIVRSQGCSNHQSPRQFVTCELSLARTMSDGCITRQRLQIWVLKCFGFIGN